MNRDDCVELGYISRAHGIRGEVKVVFDVYDLSEYEDMKNVWLAREGEALHAHRVSSFRPFKGDTVIMHFAGAADRNQAEEMIGLRLYFPLAELPALPEGRFYYFEIMGFQVEDEVLGPLGVVGDFATAGGQDILFMDYQDREVLIPAIPEFVLRADKVARVLYTRLPEGLLELYTG